MINMVITDDDDQIREYKLERWKKNIVEDSDSMIKFIGLAVVCEILLVIGYKRRENEEY